MYQIAVCDDESTVCDMVSEAIHAWDQNIKVLCFSSGEALIASYDSFDAVFLDIDMEGMNGIETGKRIREIDCETKIIYLTAYRDYVAGAFEVHAFQYLLKPVSLTQLRQILDELFRYVKRTDKMKILDFHTSDGLLCMDISEIYYFEFVNRKIKMVTHQGIYHMTGKISMIYARTHAFGFSMPHKSFVVNFLHVKNVNGLDIYLDNGDMIPLSQKKQKEWKQELAVYLSQRLEHQRREGI